MLGLKPIRIADTEEADTSLNQQTQIQTSQTDPAVELPDVEAIKEEEEDIQEIPRDLSFYNNEFNLEDKDFLETTESACKSKTNKLFGTSSDEKAQPTSKQINPVYLAMGFALLKYIF